MLLLYGAFAVELFYRLERLERDTSPKPFLGSNVGGHPVYNVGSGGSEDIVGVSKDTSACNLRRPRYNIADDSFADIHDRHALAVGRGCACCVPLSLYWLDLP